MATTTNYSWTTPDDTALVKDGAAAIRSLGTAIDTTVFNNASAAIAKTIVDAKGDIIAATAADTVSRLAVGANDTVLTADSAAATGLKWATPAVSYPTTAQATVGATETTSSSTYTDLATAGPAITMTTGTKALVIVSAAVNTAKIQNATYFMGYEVSGATTIAATDTTALATGPDSNSGAILIASRASLVSLTAGSNTFTAKYRRTANTPTFSERNIFVMNLA
jgi:hypothetical protein